MVIFRLLRALDADDLRWFCMVLLAVCIGYSWDGQWQLEAKVREMERDQWDQLTRCLDHQRRLEDLELERLEQGGEDLLPTKHLWGGGSMCVDLRVHEADR